MITLKKLTLKNIVTYDHAELDLEKKGLTVIYGRNKDSGSLETQSNGAGKSKLFTVMAETLADSHPLIQGRQAIKDDFYRKDASVSVDFDDYRLTKHKSGSTVKYALAKNVKGVWKDLKSREPLDKLAEIFPVSLDEFFTLYYIDSSRPSLLQRGTHTGRFKLFSDLFKLGGYDSVLQEIKERSKELRAKDKVLSEVRGQMGSLTPPENLDEVEELAEQKSEKLVRLRDKFDLLNRILSLKENRERIKQPIATLKEAGWDGRKKTALAILEQTEQDVRNFDEQQARYEAYLKKRAKYEADLKRYKQAAALLEETGIDTLDKLKEQQALYKEAGNIKARNAALKKELKALGKVEQPAFDKPDKPASYYGEKMMEVKARLKETKEALDNLSVLTRMGDSCKCPTCQSTVTEEYVHNVYDALNNRYASLNVKDTKLQNLHRKAKAWERYEDYKEACGRLLGNMEDMPELLIPLDENTGETLAEIKAALSLEKPAKPKEVEQPASIAETAALQNAAKTVLTFYDEILEGDKMSVDEYDNTELKESKRKMEGRLEKLQEESQALLREAGAAQQAGEQYEALQERETALSEELADLPLLKILETAYSPKGLKNIVMANLCSKVEKNLNVYAPLLYSEAVRFTLDVSETQLNILITRVFDGKEVTCDVRRLSGAESRQFNLLFPLALLPLVPSNQRLNIMVLDEPTANLDEAAVDLFSNRFLPKLKELVPHVIVLSPNLLPIDVEEAETLWVVRENGVSTLQSESP